MTDNVLALVLPQQLDRVGRDRLEVLTALIAGPTFDPLFRSDVIRVPGDHPVFLWQCLSGHCERPRFSGTELCRQHQSEWTTAQKDGVGKAAFIASARQLDGTEWMDGSPCRVCPERPSAQIGWRLCRHHHGRWLYDRGRATGVLDFDDWLAVQQSMPGYGSCRVSVCPHLAETPLSLCSGHGSRYLSEHRPGGAELPRSWWTRFERRQLPVPVAYADESAFVRWCTTAGPVSWPGQLNLAGLRPLAAAEIRWGLFAHTQRSRHTRWDIAWIQALINTCRHRAVTSLVDLELADCTTFVALLVCRAGNSPTKSCE